MANLEGIYSDKPTFVRKTDSVYIFSYVFYVDFIGAYVHEIPFHFNLEPGESSTTSESQMTCIALDTMNILGITDSIKTFTFSSNQDTTTIVLSRHHGIISLPAFLSHLVDPMLEAGPLMLAGYTDSTIVAGYRQPQFDDYFNLHPGDLIYWHRFRHGFFDGTIVRDTTYLVDTIQEVIKTLSLTSYVTNRATYSLSGTYIKTDLNTSYYYKDRIQIDDMPGWFVKETGIGEPVVFRNLILHPQESDTITVARFNEIGDYVDPDCVVSTVTDRGASFVYQTPVGLVDFRTNGISGTEYRKVIGSVVDGIPHGITEISTTAVSEIRPVTGLIYPNPTTGRIHFESDAIEFAEVYNIHGRKLMSVTLSDRYLDLRAYPNGLYFLHLKDGTGALSVARIVKQ